MCAAEGLSGAKEFGQFREPLEQAKGDAEPAEGGRRPHDQVVKFKILVPAARHAWLRPLRPARGIAAPRRAGSVGYVELPGSGLA